MIGLPRQTAVLILIFLIGAGFRFWQLDRWSLWIDELYTLQLVRNLRLLTEGIPDDQHPPLYYLLMHYLSQSRNSEVWVRLPSAIAGFLALPLMWRVGRLFYNAQTGITAAALLAFSPLHIWYSREARMYGIAILLAVVSLFFYLRSLKQGSWVDVVGLALANLLGIFLTYSTLGLWGLQISLFGLLWYLHGSELKRLTHWLMAQVIVGIGFYIWWPFFRQQLSRSNITFDWPILTRLGLDLSGSLADTIRLALSLGAVLVIISLAVWLMVWWQPKLIKWLERWRYPAAIGIVIFFLLATIAGVIPRGLSIRRQLLVFWPGAVLLGAWAFVYLKSFWLTAAVSLLCICLSLLSVLSPAYEDWRGTAEWVAAQSHVNDEIILSPPWIVLGFNYYYRGLAPYQPADSIDFTDPETVPFASGQRVWVVVLDYDSLEDHNAPVANWFETHAQPVAHHYFSRSIIVTGYEIE